MSLSFTSFLFTSYRILLLSLVYTFLTPVLKNMHFTVGSSCRLLRELVPVSNGHIYKGIFPDVCSLFFGFDFPIMIDPN
jgi:hypothetical protein